MPLKRSLSLDEIFEEINKDDSVKTLVTGMQFHKIRGVDKKHWYERNFKVDMDSLSLVTESKKWFSSGVEKIPLLEITEIRSGWKTDIFNEISNHLEEIRNNGTGDSDSYLDEACCFSVVHGAGGMETLDLLTPSAQIQIEWVDALTKLTCSIQNLYKDRKHDLFLRGKFIEADAEKNGTLNFEEICQLIENLNIQMDMKKAKKLFDNTNTNKKTEKEKNVMDQDEFLYFYYDLLKMPEIEKIFMKYASKRSELLSVNNLLEFLIREQGLGHFTLQDAAKLVQEFEIYRPQQVAFMSLNAFYHMLLSPFFNVYNYVHQETVHMDMTRPLAHYYINSSHNTYLIGNQITGANSVEGYISALKRGCKVLELDIWDGEDGKPVICHAFEGYTLSSKVLSLKSVLEDAIKPYAFHTSPYPVILSCENHLSREQQLVMVNMFKTILGDMLATDPLPKDPTLLPSPEDLKLKVIIKAKILEDEDQTSKKENGEKKTAKLIPELCQIVNVLVGKKFKDEKTEEVKLIDDRYKIYHMPSLTESKAEKFKQNKPDDVIFFTQNNLLKVYPEATRAGSSNYKPYPFWSVGAQLVTLNMQTEDKPNFYNYALFRNNGNCGYVLKPSILTKPSEDIRSPKSVRVTILSGQHLPESTRKSDILDPYVQVKARGHPSDYQMQRTSTVSNNGFNPVWNEKLDLKVNVPGVALIYFAVRDESTLAKDPVLARCCIPFHSLQTGYSHVHLTTLSGEVMAAAKLFVHIEINDCKHS